MTTNNTTGAASPAGVPVGVPYNGPINTTTNPYSSVYTTGGIANITGAGHNQWGGASNITSNWTNGSFSVLPQSNPNIFTLHDPNNKEIVKLNSDGTITWTDGIEIDEAAEAFSKSIRLGAELSAGITKSVKLRMRDSVFEDIIEMAKLKGPLSVEDLTFMLESSKIVEKLKGPGEK